MRNQEIRGPAGQKHPAQHRVTSLLAGILALVLLSLGAAPATAATTAFVGDAFFVQNFGSPTFPDADVGETFGAVFNYGDSGADATQPPFVEPNEISWDFFGDPYGSWLGNIAPQTSGFLVNIAIQNDFPLTQDEVDFLDEFFGVTVPVGTQVDVWTAAALSETANEIPVGEDEEILVNGVGWELVYFSLDNTLYDDLSYRPNPPGLDEVDIVAFFITEADSEGNTLFFAIGTVDSTVIPVPAAVWLFASALGLGGLFSRRRNRG